MINPWTRGIILIISLLGIQAAAKDLPIDWNAPIHPPERRLVSPMLELTAGWAFGRNNPIFFNYDAMAPIPVSNGSNPFLDSILKGGILEASLLPISIGEKIAGRETGLPWLSHASIDAGFLQQWTKNILLSEAECKSAQIISSCEYSNRVPIFRNRLALYGIGIPFYIYTGSGRNRDILRVKVHTGLAFSRGDIRPTGKQLFGANFFQNEEENIRSWFIKVSLSYVNLFSGRGALIYGISVIYVNQYIDFNAAGFDPVHNDITVPIFIGLTF